MQKFSVPLILAFWLLFTGCNSIPKQVYSVTVSPQSASVTQMGQSFQFEATAVVGDRNASAPQQVTGTAAWASSNPAVATVSAGAVKAVGCGTATITANYGGQIGQAQFVACGPPVLLIVKKSGATTGTVTSSPPGINCGVTCEALFDYGYSGLTLSSAPPPASWSGCDQVINNQCRLTVTPDTSTCTAQYCRTITANY